MWSAVPCWSRNSLLPVGGGVLPPGRENPSSGIAGIQNFNEGAIQNDTKLAGAEMDR